MAFQHPQVPITSSDSAANQQLPRNPRDLARLDSNAWPRWIRAIVSLLLLVHFFLIALTYFSNNSMQRTPIADQLLQRFHPYLIGFGWYTELLPMSMIGSESYDKPIEFEYRTDKNNRTWTTWIDTSTSNARWKRLGQLAGALSVIEDDEGLGQIALSLVNHASSEGLNFEQIRFTTTGEEGQNKVLLYQATIIQLSSGETTLVPQLESTRTVPGLQPGKP